MRRPFLVLALACSATAGCTARSAPPGERLRLWHTFSPTETVALNQTLLTEALSAFAVEPTVIPFAQGQRVLMRNLAPTSETCPDLVRVDATWLPALVAQDALEPLAQPLGASFAPAAAGLVVAGGKGYGVPQTIGGLALLYRQDKVAQSGLGLPPSTLGEVLAAAQRAAPLGHPGLGLRPDGYWFVPFLRAAGGDLPDPSGPDKVVEIDLAALTAALRQFATTIETHGGARALGAAAIDAPTDRLRFAQGELPFLIDGPWALPALGGATSSALGVTPLPGAPRGGQIFVVPRCARHKAAAWALADALTAAEVQLAWASETGAIPTRSEALGRAPALIKAFAAALERAEPLPPHPISAELFDDLSPAIVAVTAKDATAEEAAAGLVRGWSRLLARHGATLIPHSAPEVAP